MPFLVKRWVLEMSFGNLSKLWYCCPSYSKPIFKDGTNTSISSLSILCRLIESANKLLIARNINCSGTDELWLFAQCGQPRLLTFRLDTFALHSCPQVGQSHHIYWFVFANTSNGFRFPFFVGCHSLANSGLRYPSDFSWHNFCDEQ